MTEVTAVPLASKALCSPYTYEPSYEVHVQLDEPLWTQRSGPKVVVMDIMGLCVQLETILSGNKDTSTVRDGQRKVSFERSSSAVLQLIKATLRRAGQDTDFETFLRETGIGYLFPCVELYLQEPEQDLTAVNSTIMNGYLSHLTALNRVLALSQQIRTDLVTLPSHKYIAHQIALLYQCVSHVRELSQYKSEIEGRFGDIKSACTPPSSGHPPRLPQHLYAWLVDVTERLSALTAAPLNTLNTHLTQVLSVVNPCMQ